MSPWLETRTSSALSGPAEIESIINFMAGKSNSGEGGEDPVRWEIMEGVDAEGRHSSLPHLKGLQNGDRATSRIKQARATVVSEQGRQALEVGV